MVDDVFVESIHRSKSRYPMNETKPPPGINGSNQINHRYTNRIMIIFRALPRVNARPPEATSARCRSLWIFDRIFFPKSSARKCFFLQVNAEVGKPSNKIKSSNTTTSETNNPIKPTPPEKWFQSNHLVINNLVGSSPRGVCSGYGVFLHTLVTAVKGHTTDPQPP